MRVAIIGGTGFVGSYLTGALLDSGYTVALLVRPGSEKKVPQRDRLSTVSGDIADRESISRVLEGCDALIYNVGILRESPGKGITFESTQYEGLVNAVDVAVKAGVQRLVLMSANGVKTPGTRYQQSKYRAEEYARNSGLAVTVFRPSVIFGDPHGNMEFATQLQKEMVGPPIPAINFLPGDNSPHDAIVMSPVHVEDVASAFLVALQDKECIGKTYALGGPEILTWREMVSRVARATGRRKWFVPMPVSLMSIAASVLDWLPFFPVTREQLTMLQEGNIADPGELRALTGREPRPFSVENLEYLNR